MAVVFGMIVNPKNLALPAVVPRCRGNRTARCLDDFRKQWEATYSRLDDVLAELKATMATPPKSE
ncbi:MAG: hypothetical protein ACK5XD_08030 [Acidobacteriota bacterium]